MGLSHWHLYSCWG